MGKSKKVVMVFEVVAEFFDNRRLSLRFYANSYKSALEIAMERFKRDCDGFNENEVEHISIFQIINKDF
jgi:hypothetical protein